MSNEIWDYVLTAAAQYAHVNSEAVDEGTGATAFAEPIVYWMNRAAADAALDFAKMIEMQVDPSVARLAIQLNTDLVMGMSAAQEVLGRSYEEWSRSKAASGGTFGYSE